MTVALVVQAAVFVAALVFVVRHFSSSQLRRDLAHGEQVERLLNRIQHPERMPLPAPRPSREPVELPRDDFDLVGTIDFSEPEE